MTVGTAVQKKPLDARSPASLVSRSVSTVIVQCMAPMALETEERHDGSEQMVVDGTMGSVAVGAVFGYVAVLENEWSLLFHMTPGAGLFRRPPAEQFVLR